MRRTEELEGKGQAAYSEGMTDTVQASLESRQHLRGGVSCLLVLFQDGMSEYRVGRMRDRW